MDLIHQQIRKTRQKMNSIFPTDQSNGAIYNWLAQIQSVYSKYIWLKAQLEMLDNRLKTSSITFDKLPTQENFYAVQNIWNQKIPLMQQLSDVVRSIVVSLTETTKIILTTMESSIEIHNKISLLLNDNALGTIYSLVEQNQYQLDVKDMYRQSCLMQSIPYLLSNIEIKSQMMRLHLPNLDNLKRLIRGY